MIDVLVIAGSHSDTLTMMYVRDMLDRLGVSNRCVVSSAHRTPKRTRQLAEGAEAGEYKAIITIAGWAAALGGVVSAYCWTLPIYAVAVESDNPRHNEAAMLSIVDLPEGTPIAFCGFGKAGAVHAALETAKIVGLFRPEVRGRLCKYRQERTDSVLFEPDFTKVAMEKK